MPDMTADEALEIIRDHVYNCGYDHLGLPLVNELPPRAVEAIREAFAIATIVRNPGDAIRAFVEQHPRRADLPWYVRGLARQFCEFVLERAGAGVTHSPALVEEAGCAEERVRLAFAVLEAIEEELATPHGGGERYPVLNSLLDTARARLEAKPDADEC